MPEADVAEVIGLDEDQRDRSVDEGDPSWSDDGQRPKALSDAHQARSASRRDVKVGPNAESPVTTQLFFLGHRIEQR